MAEATSFTTVFYFKIERARPKFPFKLPLPNGNSNRNTLENIQNSV